MESQNPKYELLDVIPVPEDVPELGVEAGALATVIDVWPDGTRLLDVSDENGYTLGELYVWLDPEPRVVGGWRASDGVSIERGLT